MISGKSYDIKFTLKGSEKKIALFHDILSRADTDYPFGGSSPVKRCKSCGGMFWRLPRFELQDIKALERQIDESRALGGSFRLKIRHWKEHGNCLVDWKKNHATELECTEDVK